MEQAGLESPVCSSKRGLRARNFSVSSSVKWKDSGLPCRAVRRSTDMRPIQLAECELGQRAGTRAAITALTLPDSPLTRPPEPLGSGALSSLSKASA